MPNYKLTVRPSGEVLEVRDDQNVLEVLQEKNIYIKSSCGGNANCADCKVKIVSGEDNLSPPTFPELKLLGNVFHLTKERLACQLHLVGNVTIDIGVHDQLKDQAHLSQKKKVAPKTSPIKVRKEQEIHEKQNERAAFREEKNKKQDEWQKHWEKPESSNPNAKKFGGNKRPKFFDTDKIDYAKKDFSRPLPAHKRKEKEAESELEKEETPKSEKTFGSFRDKK